MFTGIIKELGRIEVFQKSGGVYDLAVESKEISKNIVIGDSVAVNGVCLTLTKKDKDILHFDVMEETVKRSSLASISKGMFVNLEDSLRAGSAIGGHFVLGHVDCVGRIRSIDKGDGSWKIDIGMPEGYSALVVEKGSVSIDGISLTISKVGKGSFNIHIIPHTMKITTLSSKHQGDEVNLEFDILGKYVLRSIEVKPQRHGVDERFLKEKGFA